MNDRLEELENVTNFTEFVNAFSQFGGDMVELAYVSGERQNVCIGDKSLSLRSN